MADCENIRMNAQTLIAGGTIAKCLALNGIYKNGEKHENLPMHWLFYRGVLSGRL